MKGISLLDNGGNGERTTVSNGGWFTRERMTTLGLLACTCIALFLCFKLLVPFEPALTWSLALAVIAAPLHRRVERSVKNPTAASLLVVLLVAVLIITPMLFVAHRLLTEASDTISKLEEGSADDIVTKFGNDFPTLKPWVDRLQANVNIEEGVRNIVQGMLGDISSLFKGSTAALMQFLIMLFLLFFFFRDRKLVLEQLRHFSPLTEYETRVMQKRIAESIRATIYGTLLVSIIQGALGGLIFWVLGLPSPLLWGTVMCILALIPYLGAFVVWAPAAAALILQGSFGKGIFLIAWGTVVIGYIDNVLYPLFVGNQLRLHTVTAFLAFIGGLAVFGISGIVLGPVIVSVTLALLDVWRVRTSGGEPAEKAVEQESLETISA